jgi:hypothetical protein
MCVHVPTHSYTYMGTHIEGTNDSLQSRSIGRLGLGHRDCFSVRILYVIFFFNFFLHSSTRQMLRSFRENTLRIQGWPKWGIFKPGLILLFSNFRGYFLVPWHYREERTFYLGSETLVHPSFASAYLDGCKQIIHPFWSLSPHCETISTW